MIFKLNGARAILIILAVLFVIFVILYIFFRILVFLLPLILIIIGVSYFLKILNKLKKGPKSETIDIEYKVKK